MSALKRLFCCAPKDSNRASLPFPSYCQAKCRLYHFHGYTVKPYSRTDEQHLQSLCLSGALWSVRGERFVYYRVEAFSSSHYDNRVISTTQSEDADYHSDAVKPLRVGKSTGRLWRVTPLESVTLKQKKLFGSIRESERTFYWLMGMKRHFTVIHFYQQSVITCFLFTFFSSLDLHDL